MSLYKGAKVNIVLQGKIENLHIRTEVVSDHRFDKFITLKCAIKDSHKRFIKNLIQNPYCRGILDSFLCTSIEIEDIESRLAYGKKYTTQFSPRCLVYYPHEDDISSIDITLKRAKSNKSNRFEFVSICIT